MTVFIQKKYYLLLKNMLKNIYKMSPIHCAGREDKFADLWMGTNYYFVFFDPYLAGQSHVKIKPKRLSTDSHGPTPL